MRSRTFFYVGAVTLAGCLAIGMGSRSAVVQASAIRAPRFEVDPLWPKPLPNHWVMGMTIGVSVDAQDHIWIINRPRTNDPRELHAQLDPPAAECCGSSAAGFRV